MDYQRTLSLQGDAQLALEKAVQIFVQNNFALKKIHSNKMELCGPGMTSTKENPLVGVSKAWLKLSGKQITLEAELGSVRRMQWFIWIFPIALGLFLFLIIGASEKNFRNALPVCWAISPWIVLSPLMSWWMKRRTLRSLNVLLENSAELSRGV